MAPKHSVQGPVSILSTESVWDALWKKICMFHKLHSGVNSSIIGCEFNVNASMWYMTLSAFQQKHTGCKIGEVDQKILIPPTTLL